MYFRSPSDRYVLRRTDSLLDDYPRIGDLMISASSVHIAAVFLTNLKGIGARLGHVHHDQIELMEGRMLIDIDTRRPLKFARKAESLQGDEVTIEIKYEMLYKHCSTCGMLTHEKEYCPSLTPQPRIIPPGNRPGVFARVQVPEAPSSEHKARQFNGSRYGNSDRRYESEAAYSRDGNSGQVDRIIRRQDDHSRSNRYEGSRVGNGPYDRYRGDGNSGVAWRAKKVQPRQGTERLDAASDGKDTVYYGHTSTHSNDLIIHDRKSSESKISEETQGIQRLASTIVTPSWIDREREENVTKRPKVSPRVLSFDSLRPETGGGEDRIIDTLTDMDIADQQDGGLMDYEVQNDDLMGLELAEMEEKTSHTKSAGRAPRGSKHGSKLRIPLGIQNKKFGILRRGSPHKRSSSSHDICTVGEK
ncbi:LOW QUALITY PROTEIN: hypothetical protein HID58_070411, partial [Brassica napus]